jgi:hypothetical protein
VNPHSENETWLIEAGDRVIEKKAASGATSLNTWERLVYCLWVTDYMLRNAGDFANAEVMYPQFQSDAKQLARQLSLPLTYDAFSLSQEKLEREYFERFQAICKEIKNAEPATPGH